jgi:shikimate dehydrogenase
VTRLLACAWGSWTTYGAPRPGAETAEGQFTVNDLLDTYGVTEIGKATRLYALVGRSVRRSPSPAMHRAGYREAAIDARYLPLEAEGFDEIAPLAGPDGILGLEGLAVTIPFKEDAARACETADEISKRCGAVNTVTISRAGWQGFNTDGPAALDRIRRHLDPRGRVAAIVGAGGTARAIAFALRRAGAVVTLFNRGGERAERAGRELGLPAAPLSALDSAPWEILVNATPLGADGESVTPADRLRGRLVLDAVYGARPTPLATEARERGLAVIEGFELLCAQAVRQFERMTGRPVRETTLRAAGTQWLSASAS